MQKKYNSFKKPPVETLDKAFPNNPEIEGAVLGAILIEKSALDTVIDKLNPDLFYDQRNKLITQAILDLFLDSKPIDILTVTQQLRQSGGLQDAGGAYYITELTSAVNSSAHLEAHVLFLRQLHVLRQIAEKSHHWSASAFEADTDAFDLLDKVEAQLYEIRGIGHRKEAIALKQLVKDAVMAHADRQAAFKNGIAPGIPSFPKLDRVTAGWQNTDLIIVAGRPGMGKTAFVISAAMNAAEAGHPVAVFSLEMSSQQLTDRMLASKLSIEIEAMKTGRFAPGQLEREVLEADAIANLPILIDDTPSLSIFEFRAKVRRLIQTEGVKLVIVDYLQLMTSGEKSLQLREQEISLISRNLKAVAKEFDVPVIALAQLSRAVEIRGGDKRPMLSDLRESGSIEQDADIVMFLYRPEYYGITQYEDGSQTNGVAEIIIAKHRNGSTETVNLAFTPKYVRYYDPSIAGFNAIADQQLKPLGNSVANW